MHLLTPAVCLSVYLDSITRFTVAKVNYLCRMSILLVLPLFVTRMMGYHPPSRRHKRTAFGASDMRMIVVVLRHHNLHVVCLPSIYLVLLLHVVRVYSKDPNIYAQLKCYTLACAEFRSSTRLLGPCLQTPTGVLDSTITHPHQHLMSRLDDI